MAVDNSQPRMGRVKENLERTGLVARTKIKDALQTVGEFDVVVLDAPVLPQEQCADILICPMPRTVLISGH